ncbi:MAG: heme-binding domain-containing protein, partial [Actinobacteria bacterium]|nr:heme-binding domain-containing protein [Actinomycetota bacterium]
ADEMAEEIEKGAMPPSYYTYFGMHGDAKLTESDKQQLIDGLKATLAADPPPGEHD